MGAAVAISTPAVFVLRYDISANSAFLLRQTWCTATDFNTAGRHGERVDNADVIYVGCCYFGRCRRDTVNRQKRVVSRVAQFSGSGWVWTRGNQSLLDRILMSQLVSQPLNQSLSSSIHSFTEIINLTSSVVRCLTEFLNGRKSVIIAHSNWLLDSCGSVI